MNDADVHAHLERISAQIAQLAQQIEPLIERLESRLAALDKAQRIELTEVRGLATKIDRLTRGRRRDLANL